MTADLNARLMVRFRGVRGSIPSPGRSTARYGGNTSCIELRHRGQLLILDAGSGIRGLGDELLRESRGRAVRADILITHTHWDHIQGFPFFAPAYSARHQLRLHGARSLTKRLEEALRNQMHANHFPVGLDQMHGLAGFEDLGTQPVSIGPYAVRTID